MFDKKDNQAKKGSICILRSNPVNPDSRVEKEAWTLKNAGYDVHILAWDRSTDEYETEAFVDVAGVKIPITRLGHKASFGEGFKNIKAYLAFQFHMRKWLKNHRFDVVHACDFDTAFFSRPVIHKRQKFVFDIFDFLYCEPVGIFQKIVKRAQFGIINKADATIICTEDRKRQIDGSSPKKLTVIHNTPAAAQLGNESVNLGDADKVKVVYVGILQDYRLLKEVTEVIASSNAMELHVGGFGKFEAYFIEMSQKHGNIKFYGQLSYEQTLALEKSCDVVLAIYDPAIGNHRFAAPNKFYESLMLGKPVVMVKGTGMSQLVEDYKIGVLIDYSADGFKQGMDQLVSQKELWPDMGEKMQNVYQRNYSWDEMSNRLIGLYNDLFKEM